MVPPKPPNKPIPIIGGISINAKMLNGVAYKGGFLWQILNESQVVNSPQLIDLVQTVSGCMILW